MKTLETLAASAASVSSMGAKKAKKGRRIVAFLEVNQVKNPLAREIPV